MTLLDEAIAILARVGLSARDAAKVLGMTRNAVIGRAWRAGIRFDAAQRRGHRHGDGSEIARRGWETRRASGWTHRGAISITYEWRDRKARMALEGPSRLA